MNKFTYVTLAIALASSAVLADEATNTVAKAEAKDAAAPAAAVAAKGSSSGEAAPVDLQDNGDSRWHVSVGTRFAPGVKIRAATSPRAYSALSGKMTFSGLEARSTSTSKSVKNSSSSSTETTPAASEGGRYEFDAGFIDMNDSAGVDGETWNWHLDSSASFDESTGTFTIPVGSSSPSSSSAKRSSGSKSSDATGVSSTADCVEDDLWGVDAEVGYDFFRSGRWAVGAGLGVSFFKDADAFRLSGRCRESGQERTSTQVSVASSSKITENAKVTDSNYAGEGGEAELKNDDGTYGAGEYDGYSNSYGGGNPVLAVSGVDIEKNTATETRTATSTKTTKSTLAVDVMSEGSVSTWDLRLVLQPSYRVTDWFELRGSFGAVMTHVDVDVDSTVFVNNSAYRRVSTSDDDFVFAGLCGVDAVFFLNSWLEVYAGADLRIGSDSWDFDTGLARGSVELARATYRAGIGIRF